MYKRQDGTSLTADDVVFSYDTIVGSEEDAVYKNVTNYVASCTKTGTYSVTVNFREAFSNNISALYFPIIPAAHYQGQTEMDSAANMNPVGNCLLYTSSFAKKDSGLFPIMPL